MSCFKAEMHQIRLRLGLRTRPHWGSLHSPPALWLDLREPTSRGERGRRGGKGNGAREGNERGKGKWREMRSIAWPDL